MLAASRRVRGECACIAPSRQVRQTPIEGALGALRARFQPGAMVRSRTETRRRAARSGPTASTAPSRAHLAEIAGAHPRQSLSGVWTKWEGGASIRPNAALPSDWTKSGGWRVGAGGGLAARMARTEFPSKATHAQTRAHNASLVLRALYDLGPISRAAIARLTGLTRTSVGELVAELEQEGLARDAGKAPSTGGKAPTLVELVDDARHVVTLDLGERTFTAALLDLRGKIERHATRDVDGADGDDGPRARPRPHRRDPRRPAQADPRHRRRHPGHRRQPGHDPLGRQPRLDRPPARSDPPGTLRPADRRRQRLARGRHRDLPVRRRGPPREPRRDQGRARRRRGARPRWRAVRRRRRRCRRDRPHRRRARWRRVSLRPVRLPRDDRQRAIDPARRRRGRARDRRQPRPPGGRGR